jgi:hypothetical protein
MHEEQERGLFRKKPVVISAVQYTAAVRDAWLFDKVPLPAGVSIPSNYLHPGRREVYSANAYIETLEGRMEVLLDDWVITGVKGEHYPCKPDIFAATYEPASLAKPQPVGGALTADQIDDIATQHGDWLECQEEWVFTNHELIQFARDIEAATLSAPVAQPGEAEPIYSDNPADDNYLCPAGRAQRGLPPLATPIAAQPAAAEPDLISRLNTALTKLGTIRRTYGEVGSRDVDVARANETISLARVALYQAIAAIEAAPAQAAAVPVDDGMCRSCVAGKCVTGPKCVTLGRDDE